MSEAYNTRLSEGITLDRDSSKPLYLQVYERLCDFLANSELQPGDRFPIELELVEQYDVARITVRRAIAEMVREGRLIRKAGKGTFVADPQIERQVVTVSRRSTQMETLNTQTSAHLLETRVVAATRRLARVLNVELGSPVFALVRLRCVEQVPVAIESSYASLLVCPNLDQVDFSAALLSQVLAERYDLRAVRTEHMLELTVATSWEAHQLNLSPGMPLLMVSAQVWGDHAPIEYVKTLLRGDRFRFQI